MFGLAVQALINGTPVAELGAHIKKLGFNQELRALLGAFDNFLTPNYGGAANRVADLNRGRNGLAGAASRAFAEANL